MHPETVLPLCVLPDFRLPGRIRPLSDSQSCLTSVDSFIAKVLQSFYLHISLSHDKEDKENMDSVQGLWKASPPSLQQPCKRE